MNPAEKAELLLQVAFLQRQHEAHEADRIQCEADDAMVRCEWVHIAVGDNDMLFKFPLAIGVKK